VKRRIVVVALVAVAAVLTTTALAGGSKQADPRKAAAVLVRSLRRSCHTCGSFGVTKLIHRDGALWLGVATADEPNRERARIFRWDGGQWRRVAEVRWGGWGATQWPRAVSLTGSHDPDFAIQGCGAADTNCLSVVSDVGGHWHVVPFEYGYGRARVVNGVAQTRGVSTEVDACSCAGGPSTFLYERYARGEFRPITGPGKGPTCARVPLEVAAGAGDVTTFQFDRFACVADWALAVGTGVGYAGPVVGLFNRSAVHPGQWRLMALDNGLSVPTAPTIYDLPPSLLVALERRLGPSFKPIVGATRLVGHLQHRYHGNQSSGLVRAGDGLWLVAVGRIRHVYSAAIYRWNARWWTLAGTVSHARRLAELRGAWFVSVPTRHGVAFARAGSDWVGAAQSRSKVVLTNAGGRWHVALR
jgi:hypothetical protein